MNKKLLALIFSFLGLIVGILGYDAYNSLDFSSCDLPSLPSGSAVVVEDVIDGDTFKIENGNSVRILNIDAPERGERCYIESKNRLEELILNKEVVLKEKGSDKYCRYLREVFKDGKDIGLKLVKEGFALAEDQSYIQAENRAKEEKTGCKWKEFKKIEKGGNTFEELTSSNTGLDVVEACEAGKEIGNQIIVEGFIIDTHRSETNTVFLNFEKVYPNHCFTAVIFDSDQFRFSSSPEDHYYRKKVRVKGIVKEYEGKPEIILKTPDQIEIGN